MGVVTVISDYGNKDHYVAALKGAVLCEAPSVSIVDVTHEISLFNIREAAYNIKGAFHYFPAKSVHLLCVDEKSSYNAPIIILEFENHYFVGKDNGLPSLIVQERSDFKAFEVDPRITDELPHQKEVFAKIIGHLDRGGKPEVLGRRKEEIKTVLLPNPMISAGNAKITGSIQYIDHFGNAVSNIHQNFFTEVSGSRSFEISPPRERRKLKAVYKSYHEMGLEGSLVAIFNNEGWLEIGIYKPASKNRNSAHALLGIEIDDTITIEFK